ncbi:MAG: SGNH/GDSL hydrolase family protein [Bacteroidota bacterium]
MLLKDHDLVLFQGDSVTDTGRDRSNDASLGNGYAMMAAAWFAATHPDQTVGFINKGVSGDRTRDLKARWEEDCIKLRPTVVSILIGINDCWRRYDRNDPTPVEEFERDYRYLLTRLRAAGVTKIILAEPFVLPVPEDRRRWREDLDPKIAVVRALAQEYQTLLLPLDGIFNSMATRRPPEFWAPDGVHPSPAGHALIAKEWLRMVNGNCC